LAGCCARANVGASSAAARKALEMRTCVQRGAEGLDSMNSVAGRRIAANMPCPPLEREAMREQQGAVACFNGAEVCWAFPPF
jgi:hypothetical protein